MPPPTRTPTVPSPFGPRPPTLSPFGSPVGSPFLPTPPITPLTPGGGPGVFPGFGGAPIFPSPAPGQVPLPPLSAAPPPPAAPTAPPPGTVPPAPAPVPFPTLPPVPTFSPPALPQPPQLLPTAPVQPQLPAIPQAPPPSVFTPDPQIAALIAALQQSQQVAGPTPAEQQLLQLIAALQAPPSVRPFSVQPVGDVSGSPEARAFRVAQARETERQRAAGAERLAASGLTGSGDFNALINQLGEASGVNIAGFEAGLVSDLMARRFAEAQARFGSDLAAAQARQSGLLGAAGAASSLAGLQQGARGQQTETQLALLNALLAQQGQQQGFQSASSQQDFQNQLALFNAASAQAVQPPLTPGFSPQDAALANYQASLAAFDRQVAAQQQQQAQAQAAYDRELDAYLASIAAQQNQARFAAEQALLEQQLLAAQQQNQAARPPFTPGGLAVGSPFPPAPTLPGRGF